ncbi:MAG: leucine-rich repeat protein, partial [Prevotella sp.]|nr:leucine-rich repeat protein [Prevotella sp.]
FYGCGKLESIEIPASVTSIGEEAFGGCSTLCDIWYHGTEAQWNAISSNIGLWSNPTGRTENSTEIL